MRYGEGTVPGDRQSLADPVCDVANALILFLATAFHIRKIIDRENRVVELRDALIEPGIRNIPRKHLGNSRYSNDRRSEQRCDAFSNPRSPEQVYCE
jgi:hypothetical protein